MPEGGLPDSPPAAEGEEASPRHVQVALPLPLGHSLTYLVPSGCTPFPRPGTRVLVPLGRRKLTGFVVDPGIEPPELGSGKLREIQAVLDAEPVLDAQLLAFCRWSARYYFSSWGEMLACAVPYAQRADLGRTRPAQRLHLTEKGSASAERIAAVCGRSARRRDVVAALLENPDGVASSELPRDARRLVEPLLEVGLVEWREAPPSSDPPQAEPALELNPSQDEAVQRIQQAIAGGTYQPFLLRGVTGSGKTEVYLRAAEATLAQGRGVLYLVPEIGLTPLLARRFQARFGERVAILHSGLSRAERARHWARVRRGEATVVLGARSALFAPLARPGLLVVDEEQETSFKQEERPRYHARDLALVRARESGAVVILGSATPSIESFHHALGGKYEMLELPQRIYDRPMARAEVVDMREEFQVRGVADPLSRRLEDYLRQGLERGEQSLLLLNRRGYATFVLCRECGEAVSCPACSVSLVLHLAERRLRCHYCGHSRTSPVKCPGCGGKHLHQGGEGTQRMEERLRSRFEGVRLVRLDRDTARRRGEGERILRGFADGEWDVLLGTQMVAKGHDFPRVTLVGVLAAESTLCLPDFRAAERTFHLITQVVGRSGRGETPGRAVIQTFQPDHYAIRHACAQDYRAFYDEEIRFRKLLQYPPFTVLANLVVSQREEDGARRQAEALAADLEERGKEFLRVVGPAPAPLARLRGQHRFQILLKARARGRILDVLERALEAHGQAGFSLRNVNVDMDPVSLL